MSTVAFKDTPYKLGVLRPPGFDVAGINGNSEHTWEELTPGVPDPVGGNQGVFADQLIYLEGRYYCAFWDNTATTDAVYCYSITVGDLAWTLEFDTTGVGAVQGTDSGPPFDFATDGTNIYLAFLRTINASVPADCDEEEPTMVDVALADVVVYQRDSGGSWALFGVALADTLNRNIDGSFIHKARVCASTADVGNCYVMLSEAGTTGGRSLNCGWAESTWVEGLGPSASIGRVFIEQVVTDQAGFEGQTYTPALADNYDLYNDGDQLQVFLQRPDGFTGIGGREFETEISVIKPAVDVSTVLSLALATSGTAMFVSPIWTEIGGPVRRAVTSRFASSTYTTRTVNDDASVFGHLHDNTDLDASGLLSAGVGVNRIGFYYDAVADEYWMFSSNGSIRIAGTNAKCPGIDELWEQFTVLTGGDLHTIASAQGRFEDDVFYILTSTVAGVRPKVVSFPICRECMDCSFA